MKVLLTGAQGQLGVELIRRAPTGAQLYALARSDLDISNRDAVWSVVGALRPALVINAAAYTAVDQAEGEPRLARATNTEGARWVAEAAAALVGCRMIQLSTDYVFDGISARAYDTWDAPNPINVYGLTKRQGEVAVLAVLGSRAIVLRTAWLYSGHGRNFMLTVLKKMAVGAPLHVVSDQVGTPTSAASVADIVWALAQRPALGGVWHWTDAGAASWFDFSVAIAEEGATRGLVPCDVEIQPIKTADYAATARRPASSLLDIRNTVSALDVNPWPWRRRLCQVLDELQHA